MREKPNERAEFRLLEPEKFRVVRVKKFAPRFRIKFYFSIYFENGCDKPFFF